MKLFRVWRQQRRRRRLRQSLGIRRVRPEVRSDYNLAVVLVGLIAIVTISGMLSVPGQSTLGLWLLVPAVLIVIYSTIRLVLGLRDDDN